VRAAAPPGQRDAGWTAGMRVSMRWRSATGRARVLPDFLVIGGARCGSTTLFDALCAHPQVMAPGHKEVHFFDHNHHLGLDRYRRSFPLARHRAARKRRLGLPVATGEATTYYLFHPAVPGRVAAMLPEARLIALLRDPVERAYSHYQLAVRNGRETLSFEEALRREPERLAGEEERLLVDPRARSFAHLVHSYTARGRYADQLERWYHHVPRERLLVLRSEDLFAEPAGVVAEAADFLGLERPPDRPPPARNQARYAPMAPATRERLRRLFDEPNRRLEALLGRDMGWPRPATG
jgi:hypothetical protein